MKRLGFLSDWHCGSRWGLTPPEYQTAFSPARAAWLWDTWLEFWDWAPRFDVLFLVGDLIDGKQRRSEGTSLLTTSLREQVDIARAAFRAVPAKKRPKRIIRLEGTNYHESFDGPLAAFDEEFSVWQPRAPEQSMVIDVKLPGGRGLNVKHEPEGSAALYMGTVQDRELLWSKVIEATNHLPTSTFLVRAHLHFAGLHRGFGKLLLNLPCWVLQQPYALKRRYWRWQPSIGGVSLTAAVDADLGWRENFWTRTPPALEQQTYETINL